MPKATKPAKRPAADIAPGPEKVDVIVRAPSFMDKPGLMTCFGVYKVEGGLWRLRKVVTDGDKVVEITDNQPDILQIQMGKLDAYLEGEAMSATS